MCVPPSSDTLRPPASPKVCYHFDLSLYIGHCLNSAGIPKPVSLAACLLISLSPLPPFLPSFLALCCMFLLRTCPPALIVTAFMWFWKWIGGPWAISYSDRLLFLSSSYINLRLALSLSRELQKRQLLLKHIYYFFFLINTFAFPSWGEGLAINAISSLLSFPSHSFHCLLGPSVVAY